MNADEIQKAARDRLTAIDAQLAALAAERLTLRRMLGIEPAAPARDHEFGVLRLPPGLNFPAAPYEVHEPAPLAWPLAHPPGVVFGGGPFEIRVNISADSLASMLADREAPTIHEALSRGTPFEADA
jgi:hypothetical protein